MARCQIYALGPQGKAQDLGNRLRFEELQIRAFCMKAYPDGPSSVPSGWGHFLSSYPGNQWEQRCRPAH
jgi:hypothetical protein